MRPSQRQPDQLRHVHLTRRYTKHAEGSVLVEFGDTKVICTVSIEESVPPFLREKNQGWITAEYGMLPRSTHQRMKRDKITSGGRTQEISRLIGRSLRASLDLKALGEKQILIDCDVLNADGGTRTAAITGGFVALALALKKLQGLSEIKTLPLINYVSAISVGIQGNEILLDLDYDEDSAIGTDMNFVMTDKGEFVEVQGTAEDKPFNREQLNMMMDIATKGCGELFRIQEEIVGPIFKRTQNSSF